MRKCDKYFAVSCYRYAPESFKAFYVKEFKNGNKNIPCYTEITLNSSEKSVCGNAYICKGRSAAIAELKKIIRKREQKEKHRVTYGNVLENDQTKFVYTSSLFVNADSLENRLFAFKEWKRTVIEAGYKYQAAALVETEIIPTQNGVRAHKKTEREVYEPISRKMCVISVKSNTIYQ